jgi:hypothetical protein
MSRLMPTIEGNAELINEQIPSAVAILMQLP